MLLILDIYRVKINNNCKTLGRYLPFGFQSSYSTHWHLNSQLWGDLWLFHLKLMWNCLNFILPSQLDLTGRTFPIQYNLDLKDDLPSKHSTSQHSSSHISPLTPLRGCNRGGGIPPQWHLQYVRFQPNVVESSYVWAFTLFISCFLIKMIPKTVYNNSRKQHRAPLVFWPMSLFASLQASRAY